MHRQEVPTEAKEETDEGVRERIAEAELWKEYMVKFADDRIATLKSAVGDGQGQQGTLDRTQEALERLDWKQGKKDPDHFQWAWNTSKEGDQLEETKDAAALVEGAKDHKLTIGGYRYELSVDRKFLSRRRAR